MNRIIQVPLRPLTPMEQKLLDEIREPLVKCAQEYMNDTDLDRPPPPELYELAMEVRKRYEHIGFVVTGAGIFVIDYPDILNTSDQDLKSQANLVWSDLLDRLRKDKAQ